MATADQRRNQRADEENPHTVLLREAESRPQFLPVTMFALIVNQTCESVKRGLSLVSSPREDPPWLMSADARLTMRIAFCEIMPRLWVWMDQRLDHPDQWRDWNR